MNPETGIAANLSNDRLLLSAWAEARCCHRRADAPSRADCFARADSFVAATGAQVLPGESPRYDVRRDVIVMPSVHWSRHGSRLDRDFGRRVLGDRGYAMEELVAGLGALMHGDAFGRLRRRCGGRTRRFVSSSWEKTGNVCGRPLAGTEAAFGSAVKA